MEGLRERKKRATRKAIADAAAWLFGAHGFDAVTVADVAAAAGVSTKTVFNYFPAKEMLFFDLDAQMEAALVAAIRDRAAGTSVYDAVRAFTTDGPEDRPPAATDGADDHALVAAQGPGSDAPTVTDRAEALAAHARVLAGSPALQAYAREMFHRHERALAKVIAEETGAGDDDPIPYVVASVLMAPSRTLWEMSSGRTPDPRDLDHAYDLLAGGLADYCRKSAVG